MTEELVLRKLKKTLRRNATLDDKSKMQMTEIAISLMKAICFVCMEMQNLLIL